MAGGSTSSVRSEARMLRVFHSLGFGGFRFLAGIALLPACRITCAYNAVLHTRRYRVGLRRRFSLAASVPLVRHIATVILGTHRRPFHEYALDGTRRVGLHPNKTDVVPNLAPFLRLQRGLVAWAREAAQLFSLPPPKAPGCHQAVAGSPLATAQSSQCLLGVHYLVPQQENVAARTCPPAGSQGEL
jgi:hypothetical protein